MTQSIGFLFSHTKNTKKKRIVTAVEVWQIEAVDFYEKKPDQKRWKPPIKPTYNPKEPYAHRTPC